MCYHFKPSSSRNTKFNKHFYPSQSLYPLAWNRSVRWQYQLQQNLTTREYQTLIFSWDQRGVFCFVVVVFLNVLKIFFGTASLLIHWLWNWEKREDEAGRDEATKLHVLEFTNSVIKLELNLNGFFLYWNNIKNINMQLWFKIFQKCLKIENQILQSEKTG